MPTCTTIVTKSVRDALWAYNGLLIMRDVLWGNHFYKWCDKKQRTEFFPELRFLQIKHWAAPTGRHVDVIIDEHGLRFKPDQDV